MGVAAVFLGYRGCVLPRPRLHATLSFLPCNLGLHVNPASLRWVT